MWGSSFAFSELAKKAREQADQIQLTSPNVSNFAGSLSATLGALSLDNMREETDELISSPPLGEKGHSSNIFDESNNSRNNLENDAEPKQLWKDYNVLDSTPNSTDTTNDPQESDKEAAVTGEPSFFKQQDIPFKPFVETPMSSEEDNSISVCNDEQRPSSESYSYEQQVEETLEINQLQIQPEQDDPHQQKQHQANNFENIASSDYWDDDLEDELLVISNDDEDDVLSPATDAGGDTEEHVTKSLKDEKIAQEISKNELLLESETQPCNRLEIEDRLIVNGTSEEDKMEQIITEKEVEGPESNIESSTCLAPKPSMNKSEERLSVKPSDEESSSAFRGDFTTPTSLRHASVTLLLNRASVGASTMREELEPSVAANSSVIDPQQETAQLTNSVLFQQPFYENPTVKKQPTQKQQQQQQSPVPNMDNDAILQDQQNKLCDSQEKSSINETVISLSSAVDGTAAEKNETQCNEEADEGATVGLFSSFLKNSAFNPDNSNKGGSNANEAFASSEGLTNAKDEDIIAKESSIASNITTSCISSEILATQVATTSESPSLHNDDIIISAEPNFPTEVEESLPSKNSDVNSDNDQVVRNFIEQIQRLDQHHSSEIAELTRKHKEELDKLRNEQKSNNSKIDSSSSSAQKYRKQVESLQEKCEQLQTSFKNQEQQFKKLAEKHNSTLIEKEESIHTLKCNLSSSNRRLLELETLLREEEHKVKSTAEQYDVLKNRVKSVAQELKERRVECRGLSLQVEELKASNTALKNEAERLQKELISKVNDAEDISNKEAIYQTTRKFLEEKITKLEKDVSEERRKGEQALLTYKNKSVKALGDAQRRVASANQAKSDAEAELIVLRANLDDMQATLDQMNDRVEDRLKDYKENSKQLLEKISEKEMLLSQTEQELSSQQDVHQKLVQKNSRIEKELAQTRAEWEQVQCSYHKEKDQNRELVKCNVQLESDLKELNGELNMIKEEYEDLMQSNGSKRIKMKKAASSEEASGLEGNDNFVGDFHVRRRDDMVAILQEDLLEANKAIDGLKEALRQALLQNKKKQKNVSSRSRQSYQRLGVEENDYDDDNASIGEDALTDISLRESQDSNNNREPNSALFYAFEKQAELVTARDEINRLANIIGEVQSEKQDALDEIKKLQNKLEDTEAKLNRQSKLMGPAIGLSNNASKATSASKGKARAEENVAEEAAMAASANIEYLKHVMLRYLRARTTSEKRALLPVISAVLCLTVDEKKSVERAVEETGGFAGMGTAFIESLETLAASTSGSSTGARGF